MPKLANLLIELVLLCVFLCALFGFFLLLRPIIGFLAAVLVIVTLVSLSTAMILLAMDIMDIDQY